ncbi:MAG: hypothetical protein P4L84_03505 [Isosphaeraceae bacterium]|nr:hypothetical protein [Isosphaeraceae bacterium]
MKQTLATRLIMALAVVALSGCNQGTAGGPGVTSPSQKQPAYGEADNTFNLSVPPMSTTLQQGGEQEVSIGIKRGRNFSEDVRLKVAEGPKGVTIESVQPVIKHGDTETKLKLKADADASLGDFTVKVTGHPTRGADASNDVQFTVAKK